MTERYYLELPIEPGSVTIAGPEAHHLLHVMRAKPGDEVILFDGSGREFVARVERTLRTAVEMHASAGELVDRELPFPIHLGVALPKGDRQRWLVEKAVELGVAELTPLITQRSSAAEAGAERLRRVVIEASKQCGRNRLMTITPPQTWAAFVTRAPQVHARWVADPSGSQQIHELAMRTAPTTDVWLAVGPEGGFTFEEVQTALAIGWHGVQLGSRILRIETAALMLAAVAAAMQGRPTT